MSKEEKKKELEEVARKEKEVRKEELLKERAEERAATYRQKMPYGSSRHGVEKMRRRYRRRKPSTI